MEIEIDIVVFSQGIKVGEIHAEKILRLESAEGGHACYRRLVPLDQRKQAYLPQVIVVPFSHWPLHKLEFNVHFRTATLTVLILGVPRDVCG